MNSVEFSKRIDPKTLGYVYKNYFEQHMAAYYMLKGMKACELVSVRIPEIENKDDGFIYSDGEKSYIRYSLRMLDESDKEDILNMLNGKASEYSVYGVMVKPRVFVNGDLLNLEIHKVDN